MIDLFGTPHIKNQVVPALPYMGSKRKLATKLLNEIYKTVGNFDTLYDLFGGGAAMSMTGLLAGHNVHYNELNTGICELLKYLQNGGKIPLDWVSREEFEKHKNDNGWYGGLIKTCWSFGNNQRDYLYGKDIENLKKEATDYLFANGYLENQNSENRVKLLKEFKEKAKIDDRFALEQLEQLERLQQLQRLQRLQQLTITNLSYSEVLIEPNSVIYCDPPYFGTVKYQEDSFNHDDFYRWCLENPNPVFISSYEMPSDFVEIASFEHRSTLSSTANNKVFEKLFWNKKLL